MRTSIIEEAVQPLDNFISRKTEMLAFSEDSECTPIPISVDNFHTIGLFPSTSKIIAVDGGNATLLCAPNFSLQFIRVTAVFYQGNKQEKILKKEFFCFIKAETKVSQKYYSVEIVGDNLFGNKQFELNSMLSTIDGEKYTVEADAVGGIIRRYAELRLAESVAQEVTHAHILVDGSSQAKTEEEKEYIAAAITAANKNNNVIGFFSKTCRLLTQNAASLNAVLNELGPKSTWYYYPVFNVKNSKFLGDICFVKLNSKSVYVFKLEMPLGVNDECREEFIKSLVAQATDPVFVGYPYCLVHADKLARVSNAEQEYLKTIFLSKVKNKERLRYLLNNLDAHSILDSIEF